MPFTVPSFEQLRDNYLQAVRNQRPDAATGADSDHYVRACACAALLEQLYAHQAWVFRQAFPDLADADNMRAAAARYGIDARPAAVASGTVRFGGAAGAAVPLGTTITTLAASYRTTAAAVVGSTGTVDVAAVATTAGAAANVSALTAANLDAPPTDIATAHVVSMTGGIDAESDASLLERLLLTLREPAQGGNATDYKRWALQVPGVRRAFVFPLRRGLGTVDIIPMPETGMPGPALLAAVKAHIDELKPVGMGTSGVLAIAPTVLDVPVTGSLTLSAGYTSAQVLPNVQTSLRRVFDDTDPGEVLPKSRLITAVMNVVGVADVTLTAPAGNIVPLVNDTVVELPLLGTVTLTI